MTIPMSSPDLTEREIQAVLDVLRTPRLSMGPQQEAFEGAVARRVVGPVARLKPAFVEMPLDLRDPFVATLLGSIVSLTPGTVSITVDQERWVLCLHALDVPDPDALIRQIKHRYEAPLMEIFAC